MDKEEKEDLKNFLPGRTEGWGEEAPPETLMRRRSRLLQRPPQGQGQDRLRKCLPLEEHDLGGAGGSKEKEKASKKKIGYGNFWFVQ